MKKIKKIMGIFLFLFSHNYILAQDFNPQQEYEIAAISVTGSNQYDASTLIAYSGLQVGQKIKLNSSKIGQAIQALWDQKLFAHIEINVSKVEGVFVYLDIVVTESPKVSQVVFVGIKKSEKEDLNAKIKNLKGKVLTESAQEQLVNQIKKYYLEKGFLNTDISFQNIPDPLLPNNYTLRIIIQKNKKIKIENIFITGNKEVKTHVLLRSLKETKQKRWYSFSSSKFFPEKWEEDKQELIKKYASLGFRDAFIVSDSIEKINSKRIAIHLVVDEGKKFYFRNINFTGNTKFSSDVLHKILGIQKGDVFNQKLLQEKINGGADGNDITTLYMDDGYLFFYPEIVETNVSNDSIDFEIRLFEGQQARINHVTVVGNEKTRNQVILREIRTRPGQLFSRSDVIRTIRELSQLGYFDEQKLNVTPKPNREDGTVDIEYTVEEKSSTQVGASGGWGGGSNFIGSLELSNKNFSLRKVFAKDGWRPIPIGDGQQLVLRFQTNGPRYQNYFVSFQEPWLGGKKPNALSISFNRSLQNNNLSGKDRQELSIWGGSVGLGKRLQWPDDYFSLSQDISYQYYELNNYTRTFIFQNGIANLITYNVTLARRSYDSPIYPRVGSSFKLIGEFSPPYSLFEKNVDYSKLSDQEKYRFIESYKLKFHSQIFNNIAGNLVFSSKFSLGYLGVYNDKKGEPPMGRFYMGGSGLSAYVIDAREIIALRGYPDASINPEDGGRVAHKFSFETRYPLILSAATTIYTLGFFEAGNNWNNMNELNIWSVKRSVGMGFRIFMPIFGVIGFDYGFRLDGIKGDNSARTGEFHFMIGTTLDNW